MAQVLSSPLGAGAAAGSVPATALGQGAGQHGPNSPFPQLPVRNDVVPWSVLTSVKPRTVGKRILPAFPADVSAMDGRVQRIQGFMMPLAPGAMQKHFLVSAVPLTCPFCTPGGPESMVEVTTAKPVKYGMEGVVVEGQFHVLPDDPQGLFYRMTDAQSVK